MAYRNPFRLQATDFLEDGGEFLRLFGADALEIFDPQEMWGRMQIIRSPRGGGKTSVLWIFAPGYLNAIRRNTTVDLAPLREKLKDMGALSGTGEAMVLGVPVSLSSNYEVIEHLGLDEAARDRLFFSLITSKIMIAALQGACELKEIKFPDGLDQIRVERPNDSNIRACIPVPCDGLTLYRWAEELDGRVYDMLEGQQVSHKNLGGHETLSPIRAIRACNMFYRGEPVAERTLLLLDNADNFTSSQRTKLAAALAGLRMSGIVVAERLESLRRELAGASVSAPVMLMQSNGGLTTVEDAIRLPCNVIESGPAGGVVGAQALARKVGLPDVITLDMGGTTAKASLVEGGEYTRSLEYSVGGGIMQGSRLLTGAGYLIKVPAIDLAEVGAGGGSIVRVDAGGSMQCGPESAGAAPGPVCYGRGGEAPTITDANVVLGYLNPNHLVGGELEIDAERSRRVFEERIARPLGLEPAHAAYGAHRIAASNMIRAIRSVSSERGRDPRRYAMFAFGGNGPLFAGTMAAALHMKRILVPPAPGLFSAFGLLYADVEHHYSRTFRRVLTEADPAEIDRAWRALEEEGRGQLAQEGFPAERMRFRRTANLHYRGQIYELNVAAPPVDGTAVDRAWLDRLAEAFGAEHERTYGHRAGPEEPVELVNMMVVAEGLPAAPVVPDALHLDRARGGAEAAGSAGSGSRNAYFGPETGWIETPVIGRPDLEEGAAAAGPLIVEEYDATCLVPPGARASLDGYGSIVIDL